MIYLIHSSKTMRTSVIAKSKTTTPKFIAQANQLSDYMKSMNEKDIGRVMKISPKLSAKTKTLIDEWSSSSKGQTSAIDSFLGDIYSGLQAHNLDARDRNFAQKHLRILSGLYGILKPLDAIVPYRLEMGYKLPDKRFNNLYKFWGELLSNEINGEPIINLSSAEYSKAILPHVGDTQVVTPKFLTVSPKNKTPEFVVVHAKIARGACAHWLIKNRVQTFAGLCDFNAIGYKFNKSLSSPAEPVFVAKNFGGTGLSVRLT